MDKKKDLRITVFDYSITDCVNISASVRDYYEGGKVPVEIAEFTVFAPFVHDFKENSDLGKPYDMVFIGVDSMMGAEVARHIRSIDKICPIFMASHVSDFAMEGFRLNASDYFSKPVTVEKIKTAVNRVKVR